MEYSGAEALEQLTLTQEDKSTPIEQAVQTRNLKTQGLMIQKYAKQHTVKEFETTDVVTLLIPKDDQAPTDIKWLPCLIVDVPYPNQHYLKTRYGLLSNLYPTRQLNAVSEELWASYFDKIMLGPDTDITLHPAARENSMAERVTVSCSCKRKCISRCRCKKNSISCSIYCHDEDYNCGNLSTLTDRTEVGLINRPTTPPPPKASSSKHQQAPSTSGKSPSKKKQCQQAPKPPPQRQQQAPKPPSKQGQ